MKPEVRAWVAGLGGSDGTGSTAERVLGSTRGRLLDAYAEWLRQEGIPAGLLSPTEGGRIVGRHIEDSLSFLVGWPDMPPATLHDVGSGGGLPGIPLGIVLPETHVVLVERSEKRAGLLRRAVRLLELGNVEILKGELEGLGNCEAIAMRGVLPPVRGVPWTESALRPGGVGVIGLSRRRDRDSEWAQLGGTVVEVQVLDPPGWLLIIRKRGH
ncbi:MAG: RsmG family class I SAM-dependent methyltransferase [Acidimicrobiia bacterium]